MLARLTTRPTGRIARLLVAAGWLVAAGLAVAEAAHALLGERWVPLIAVGAAGPLLLWPAWLVLGVAAGARRIALGVLAVALIALQLAWLHPSLPGAQAAEPAHRLRVLEANLEYDNADTAAVAGQIRRSDPDLVVFVEYSPTSRVQVDDSGALTAYPYRLIAARGGSVGLAIYSKLPLAGAQQKTLVEDYRPLLTARVDVDGQPVQVFAAHTVAPRTATDAAAWHAELAALAADVAAVHGPVLVAGDLNATATTDAFGALRAAGHLTETGPGVHLAATWPMHAPIPPVLRPDHVLVSAPLHPIAAATGAASGSDHLPVIVDIATR